MNPARSEPPWHSLQTEDQPNPESGINVPLVVGLLSGLGGFLLVTCLALLYYLFNRRSFGRIALIHNRPGELDDEAAIQQDEAEHLPDLSEEERRRYLEAKAFQQQFPPNSEAALSLSDYLIIQEKGVAAWHFQPPDIPSVFSEFSDFPPACAIEDRVELQFGPDTCCVQTNLPIPRQNAVYYFEAKIYEKAPGTLISIGVAARPYPGFCLPGRHRVSAAYDSSGERRVNQPFGGVEMFPEVAQGDVVGVGYKPRTGTVFFTRNGKKLRTGNVTGLLVDLYPTVGADGPCAVHVNLGQLGYVLIEANVKKWEFAPAQGSLAAPPAYGAEADTVLLEAGGSEGSDFPFGRYSPPPSFAKVVSEDEARDNITLRSMYGHGSQDSFGAEFGEEMPLLAETEAEADAEAQAGPSESPPSYRNVVAALSGPSEPSGPSGPIGRRRSKGKARLLRENSDDVEVQTEEAEPSEHTEQAEEAEQTTEVAEAEHAEPSEEAELRVGSSSPDGDAASVEEMAGQAETVLKAQSRVGSEVSLETAETGEEDGVADYEARTVDGESLSSGSGPTSDTEAEEPAGTSERGEE